MASTLALVDTCKAPSSWLPIEGASGSFDPQKRGIAHRPGPNEAADVPPTCEEWPRTMRALTAAGRGSRPISSWPRLRSCRGKLSASRWNRVAGQFPTNGVAPSDQSKHSDVLGPSHNRRDAVNVSDRVEELRQFLLPKNQSDVSHQTTRRPKLSVIRAASSLKGQHRSIRAPRGAAPPAVSDAPTGSLC